MSIRYAALLLLFTALAAHAQRFAPRKHDFHLEHFLAQPHAPGESMDLFIHGDADRVAEAVRAHGGLVKRTRDGLVAARVPVAAVLDLGRHSAVKRFEFSLDRGELLGDSMRVKARVNQVHAGLPPLPQAYDGQGVVLGFIDSGLDVNHPDFRNPNGTSRVAHYWDQNLSGAGAPPEFGYGREWSNAQINGGQLGSTDSGAHGTTVTGNGAGNGLANGRHKGVAPAADIIVVKYSGQGDFRAKVADAADYIYRRALAMGKPAVVNASLGTYSGSHDGLDAAALFIDDMLDERPGRAFVCAAGNAGQWGPMHRRLEPAGDTVFTWFLTNSYPPPGNLFNYPNVFFEVWADIADFQNMQYAIGADRVTPGYAYRGRTAYHTMAQNLGGIITEPLVSTSGNVLANVQFSMQQRGQQVQLQVFMPQPDSGSYNWRFMVTGTGRCEIWSTAAFGTANMASNEIAAGSVPTASEYPPMAKHRAPDRDKHIVDSWACSGHTLTTANYLNQMEYQPCTGPYINFGVSPWLLSGNSSAGPTRDDRWKPDIAAPGDITMAAAPLPILADWVNTNADKMDQQCMHVRNGGTSMASPVVAGVAALYLQKCPSATWQQVRNAIIGTAWGDGITGALPNKYFGYGRVHAFDALVSSNLPGITATASDDAMCSNTSVTVTAPAGYSSYWWSNGSIGNPITYTGTGPLTVNASTGSGCAQSNALAFTVHPAPATPVITVDGALLTSSAGPSYQWYLNGQPLIGATAASLWADQLGNYTVEHVDANGCAAMSAPVNLTVLSARAADGAAFTVAPSPTSAGFTVRLPMAAQGAAQARLFDGQGKQVWSDRITATPAFDVPASAMSAGTYLLQVEADGQRWMARIVRLP